jgi:DNA-binding CsgD family transcriptional regulator
MERARQRDLESLLLYLRGLYSYRDSEELTAHVVSTLPEVVPSESTSYNEVDLRSGQVWWVTKPDLFSGFPEGGQIFERQVNEHPIIAHHQKTGDGRAAKISDFLTLRQFHRLGLYNEFYRRLETERQMAVILPAPAPLVIGVAVNRSGRDFSERERLLLNLLRPHLAQAYHNAQAATRLKQEFAHVSQAVEASNRGVISLKGKDRVQWCTEQARQWLSEYFEPSRRVDYLPETLQRWIEHQWSLLSEGNDVPPPRRPLVLERAGKRLVVRLVADPSEDLLLLVLEEQPSPFSGGSLESLGLTRREAEILLWIVRGKTNKEIASGLYISPLTVRKHLEHVYQKLGVESRTEATARALDFFSLLPG